MGLIGKMIDPRHVRAVDLLPEVLLLVLDHIALEAVGPAMRFDPVGLADQPGQPIVSDRDVQIVRIVIAHVLPVDTARAGTHRSHALHVLETIAAHFGIERSHHLGHRWETGVFQPDEDEAVPDLYIDLGQPVFLKLERGVFALHRHTGQPPVGFINPGVIGANQLLGAAHRPFDQPHRAMPANVGKGAHLAVIAADHDHAFTQIVQRLIVARIGNLVHMADDLPRRTEDPLHLKIHEFLIGVDPPRKTEIGVRIDVWSIDFGKDVIELAHACAPANP